MGADGMACLAPNKLADGTEVACRECKPCQLKAKNTWIGRNMAESKTSRFCYWITGTYGRGKVGESLHERAVILTYSDPQKFLKLLRRHGYVVRFFITGEYGSEKQRAHWNMVIYSDKPLPPFSGWDQYGRWTKKAKLTQHFNWVRCDSDGNAVHLQDGSPAWWWPHGFVHIDEVNVQTLRYVCAYVLKDFDANGRQGHKGQSKSPPLGTKYFQQLAEKYVEQGIAPRSPEYRFPEAKTREGQPINYWLEGRALELFLQHFIEKWAEKRPGQPRPRSEFVDLYEKYGKVVNDEAAMLLRQEFPRGESRHKFPAADDIKEGAEEERYRRAAADFSMGADKLRWEERKWIEQVDGQERQERQKLIEHEHAKRWEEFNHKQQRHWYEGVGWVRRSGQQGPCDCCEQRADVLRGAEPDAGGSPSGRGRGQPEQLGPVGRYNRDYAGSDGAGDYAGTGQSRAGGARPGNPKH